MAIAKSAQDVAARFRQLADEWKSQSEYLSNTLQMAVIEEYQKIIGLGPQALPCILQELQREPDHWFWALEMIADENPVPLADRGSVPAMTAAWLKWGQTHGYLP